MQKKLVFLKVGHLTQAIEAVWDNTKLTPWILFPRTTRAVQAMLSTLSEASLTISSRKCYGQISLVIGIRTKMEDGSEHFHLLDYVSVKERRIFHWKYSAEISALAEGDDRGFYLRPGMRLLFPKTERRNEIAIGWMVLYETVKTLHEGNEYCIYTKVWSSFVIVARHVKWKLFCESQDLIIQLMH